jgi:hypothetical protein
VKAGAVVKSSRIRARHRSAATFGVIRIRFWLRRLQLAAQDVKWLAGVVQFRAIRVITRIIRETALSRALEFQPWPSAAGKGRRADIRSHFASPDEMN